MYVGICSTPGLADTRAKFLTAKVLVLDPANLPSLHLLRAHIAYRALDCFWIAFDMAPRHKLHSDLLPRLTQPPGKRTIGDHLRHTQPTCPCANTSQKTRLQSSAILSPT